MTRPDWCPADVWEAVDATFEANKHEPASGLGLRIMMARAALAERDRVEALLKDPATVRVNYLRGGIACQPLIDEAVAAECERCAGVANERAAQLVAAIGQATDADAKAGWAGQMIEAILIEQRLRDGHVPTESFNVDGLRAEAASIGFAAHANT